MARAMPNRSSPASDVVGTATFSDVGVAVGVVVGVEVERSGRLPAR
jgi:predicted naringenin-chalcone synthase